MGAVLEGEQRNLGCTHVLMLYDLGGPTEAQLAVQQFWALTWAAVLIAGNLAGLMFILKERWQIRLLDRLNAAMERIRDARGD